MKLLTSLLLFLLMAGTSFAAIDSSADLAVAKNLKIALAKALSANSIKSHYMPEYGKPGYQWTTWTYLEMIDHAGNKQDADNAKGIYMVTRNAAGPRALLVEARGLLKDVPTTSDSRTFEKRYLVPAIEALDDFKDNPRSYKQSSVDALRYLSAELRTAMHGVQ